MFYRPPLPEPLTEQEMKFLALCAKQRLAISRMLEAVTFDPKTRPSHFTDNFVARLKLEADVASSEFRYELYRLSEESAKRLVGECHRMDYSQAQNAIENYLELLRDCGNTSNVSNG